MKADWIKNIKLPKIANKHPIAFWTAIALHLALVVGLVFSSVQRWEIPKTAPKSSKAVPKAVTVDLTEIKKEKQRLINVKQKREKRLEDLKRAEKRVENERYKEQQRLKKLKAKTKKEKLAEAQAEKSRKVAEQKKKLALKEKRLAEEQANKAEARKKLAEKKAKAAEQEKQKIEKLRKVEANKFEKEQDTRSLKKEIQAEEDQEREFAQEDILNELKANYINQIASRVKEQWRYQGAKDNWGCDVYILQDLNGKVQSVNLQSCNVTNGAKAKVFKDAIERAVYKASPLPPAPDKSVYDREILFHFRVN
ncbi:TonB C-terminal domain-containing protein [Candidatus Thioglobus sp.]|jgi:colicin import membrane protein|nr:TonB C-terminal domain-containing protein [Candidatus Thioglobus sp.]